MDFNRTSTSDSFVSNESLSSSKVSTRSSRLGFESKTSATALPDLPLHHTLETNDNYKEVHKKDSNDDDNLLTFVEFNLTHNGIGSPDTKVSEKIIGTKRDERDENKEDEDNQNGYDKNKQLENSELIVPEKSDPDSDDFFKINSSNWKAMKTITELDYYDSKGNPEFISDKKLGILDHWNSRGYTKIDPEEQVAKYAELDKKTDFLFKTDKKEKIHKEEGDLDFEDDDELNSRETLESTKNMLTLAQRYSYVGTARLLMVDMATDLANIRQKSSRRVAQSLSGAQKNFANWTKYIMGKIYDHMDLNPEEKEMIENLSAHGVEVSDFTVNFLEKCSKPEIVELSEKENLDLRMVIVCDLLLLLLSDGYYDSRSRVLLLRFANHMGISNIQIFQLERRLLDSLELDSQGKSIDNDDEKLNDRLFIEKQINKNKKKRMAYIGLATLGGSLAIGLSAGLLAPVIGAGFAAGLTTVGITGTSGFLAGVGGSTIITTGGVAVGAKVGSKAGAKRTADVQTFEFKPLFDNRRANLIITVSGWIQGQADDVRLPFSTVDPIMGDMFSILWEPEMLRSMGQTIGILASEALTSSIQQILGATFLSTLMSAIQLPVALSKLSYLLDNPWNLSLDRAWRAGIILADTLISGNMGVRPITLVGFSLGARVVYSCLIELSKRGGYGIVENAIILGTPVAVKTNQISLARSVVSGDFVNGYSKKDWVLGYLFRATGGGLLAVAGLSPIEVAGIRNVDCTDLADGHMSYRRAIPKILKRIGWEVLSEEFTEIEEPDPEQKEKTRKLVSEFDEARQKMQVQSYKSTQKTWKDWWKTLHKEWWDTVGYKKNETEGQEENAEETKNPEERTEAIFDLSALMSEVNEIEHLAEQDPETMNKIRHDVEKPHETTLKLNEDSEEAEPKKNLFDKFGGVFKSNTEE